jgi:hypothetical protein
VGGERKNTREDESEVEVWKRRSGAPYADPELFLLVSPEK